MKPSARACGGAAAAGGDSSDGADTSLQKLGLLLPIVLLRIRWTICASVSRSCRSLNALRTRGVCTANDRGESTSFDAEAANSCPPYKVSYDRRCNGMVRVVSGEW